MFKFAQTQIVSSSLEDRSLERKRNGLGQQRDIPLPELILQIDRMRADHHLLAGLDALVNGRQ
ncbi:hypothetical protein D3C71_1365180 [compost metagenome]